MSAEQTEKTDLWLAFPPLVETNFGSFYPSTAVLAAYLERQGLRTVQDDLNEEFALWLLWSRFRRSGYSLGADARPGYWWGLPLLAVGLAAHLTGVYFFVDWISEASLLLSLTGLCVCLGGWSLARLAGPSIAFLASSAWQMPLRSSGSVVSERSQARSSQLSAGSLKPASTVSAAARGSSCGGFSSFALNSGSLK